MATVWPSSDPRATHHLWEEVDPHLLLRLSGAHLHLSVCRCDVLLNPCGHYRLNFQWPVLHWHEHNNKSNKLLFVLHFSKASAARGAIKWKNIMARNINLGGRYKGNLNTSLKLQHFQSSNASEAVCKMFFLFLRRVAIDYDGESGM